MIELLDIDTTLGYIKRGTLSRTKVKVALSYSAGHIQINCHVQVQGCKAGTDPGLGSKGTAQVEDES